MARYPFVHRIAVCLLLALSTVCLGAEKSENRLCKAFGSQQHYDDEDMHSLDIFYGKKEGRDVCSAVVKLNNHNWRARFDNLSEDVVRKIKEEQSSLQPSEKLYLRVDLDKQPFNLCVDSVNYIHGPKKYHNLPKAKISTNGAIMNINILGDATQPARSWQLYNPENIKRIIAVLKRGKGCIIELDMGLTKARPKIKVADYASSWWIWWNGWIPGWQQFEGCPGMPYDAAKKTEYEVVTLPYTIDEKGESLYIRNQRIGKAMRILSVLAVFCALYHLFKDRVDTVLKDEFDWVPRMFGLFK